METINNHEENKQITEISTNTVEEEPLLGSVTTFNNVEGGEVKSQQIRSSARVFKKMKLELVSSPVTEKREKKEDNKQDNKKVYRPLWNYDDKTMFFEALNEYGKDFENIQLYISSKLKKKGVPEHLIKTKDQVRHLYYRTWHKICKYVKFSEGIKKVVQELYGIINYGELRKKLGSVSEKSCLKLNELIYQGCTMLRVKGKNVRVRTPMCRALRKLNQLDEKYDEIKLPNRVTVELKPKHMDAFFKVQSLAQNPRLRVTLPLQKRLSSLIVCMSKRWKTVEANTYERALVSSSAVTADCVPPVKESDEKKLMFMSSLRLTPPDNCKIELPSINLSEYFTRQSICLTAYENRVGIKSSNDIRSYSYKLVTKQNSKKNFRQRADSSSDKVLSKSNVKVEDAEACWNDMESDTVVNKVVDDAVNTILALQQSDSQGSEEGKNDVKVKVEIKLEKKDEGEIDLFNEEKLARIENVRKGWNEQESESLTIGEIYLMYGSDSKLIMEYSWDDNLPTQSNGNRGATAGDFLESWNDADDDYISNEARNLDLTHSLSKLLSLAKLQYRENRIKCPCGHTCGTKNNNHIKALGGQKIRKVLQDKFSEEAEEKLQPEENVLVNDGQFLTPSSYVQTEMTNTSFFPSQHSQMMYSRTHQLNSFEKFKPRYCNRRGRIPRSKQVVVERKLPLLPNKVESGHQIVRMNIISQESQTNIVPSNEQSTSGNFTSIQSSNETLSQNLNDENSVISNVTSSPSRILKEGDGHWINSEVADYSLSSLLGHLESPMKTNNSGSNLGNEDSRMSQDVDAQLHSLLTESSMDFAANFADLAAVVNEIKK